MELKKCPMCGGEPIVILRNIKGDAYVRCSLCDARTDLYESDERAIKVWNKVLYFATKPERKLVDAEEVRKTVTAYLKSHDVPYDIIKDVGDLISSVPRVE